jgi:hypothetical protein
MKIVRLSRFTLLLAMPFGAPDLTVGADAPADDKARAAEALTFARREAASYQFLATGGGAELTLHPEPVLRWTNPVFGTVFGDIFIWTAKGRPEVVGAFVKWYHPFTHSTDEFHSLALGPVLGRQEGREVWNSARPGVELRPIPGAMPPGSTPGQRLRQMLELVKEFSGRETDEKGVDRDLRLLSHPLYRYEQTEGDLLDGALFTFALATDPEVFLLVEARKVDGASRWDYALCRMTTLQLRITHRDTPVWDAPAIGGGEVYGHRAPYTKFHSETPRRSAR